MMGVPSAHWLRWTYVLAFILTLAMALKVLHSYRSETYWVSVKVSIKFALSTRLARSAEGADSFRGTLKLWPFFSSHAPGRTKLACFVLSYVPLTLLWNAAKLHIYIRIALE